MMTHLNDGRFPSLAVSLTWHGTTSPTAPPTTPCHLRRFNPLRTRALSTTGSCRLLQTIGNNTLNSKTPLPGGIWSNPKDWKQRGPPRMVAYYVGWGRPCGFQSDGPMGHALGLSPAQNGWFLLKKSRECVIWEPHMLDGAGEKTNSAK